jgi:hypothetical protein
VTGQLVHAVVGDPVGGRAHLLETVLSEIEVGLFGEKYWIIRHD